MRYILLFIFSLYLINANALRPLGSPKAKKGGTLKFNLGLTPQTLNPLIAHDRYSIKVMRWMAESLFARDEETYEWVPLLAERYEVTADNLNFTVFLRKNVRFHDGSPFTADDVKFSFEVYGSDLYKTAIENSSFINFEKIEVLDQYTVRFRLKESFFDNFDRIATTVIVPKGVYGDKNKISTLNKTVVGSGPYRLKEYNLGYYLILERNLEWWGWDLPQNRGKFNFDLINARFVVDDNTIHLMLEKGDLDFAGISLDNFLHKTQTPLWQKNLQAAKIDSQAVFTTQTSLFWNLRLPLFQNIKVRQALQMFFDRETINKKMRENTALLATGPWHRLSEYADPIIKPVLFQEKAAALLLKNDGWKDSDEDGVLDKVIDGKKVVFRFTVYLPRKDIEKYLSSYQLTLKKNGIIMNLLHLDWVTFMKNLDTLNFEGYVVGRGFPGVVDFNPRHEWHSQFRNKLEGNVIGYQNAQVDDLLTRAEKELNRPKRITLLRQAYRLVAADQSQLFWFSEPYEYQAYNKRLHVEKVNYKYLPGLDYWWVK